jgi:hypothetical protein
MSRLDLDPVNQLAQLLKQAEDDLIQLKNRQRYSGGAGLRGYFVTNPGDWDISSSATNTFRDFEAIYTSSGLQPFPIENIQLDIRFGGTGESNKVRELPSGFYGYNDGVNFATIFTHVPEYDKAYCSSENQYRWAFGFNISGTLSYYIKAYVSGSSDGAVLIRQVAP